MQERLRWQQQTNMWLFPSTSFAQGLNMKNWLPENEVYLCLRWNQTLNFLPAALRALGPAVKVKEPAFRLTLPLTSIAPVAYLGSQSPTSQRPKAAEPTPTVPFTNHSFYSVGLQGL